MSKQVYSPKTSNMVFNELRLERYFCDAVVRTDHVEFPVHKVILCSCSPYFRAMFQGWVKESKREFKVDGVSSKIMELLLEWIYTGSIILTKDNVQDLAKGADMLLIKELVELCFNYMEDNMCPENCISIWKFANVVVSKSVRKNAQSYILSHFEEVVVCDEFQELTVDELVSLIENGELNVKIETAVYEAILHLTNHAPEVRSADSAKGLLSQCQDFLNKNTDLEDKISDCRRKLEEERKKSETLENTFMVLAASNQAIIGFEGLSETDSTNTVLQSRKDDKSQNAELNQSEKELLLSKIQDQDVVVQSLKEGLKLLKEQRELIVKDYSEKMAEVKTRLQKQAHDYEAKEASLTEIIQSGKEMQRNTDATLKDLNAQIKETEEENVSKELSMMRTIETLNKEKYKLLHQLVEEGKQIQETQQEHELMIKQLKEEQSMRTKVEESYKKKTEAAYAKVMSLDNALEETSTKFENLKKDFEAFQEHSTDILIQEQELNKKLQVMKG